MASTRMHLRRIPPSDGNSNSSSHNQEALILLDTYVRFGRNAELCDVVLSSSVSSTSSNMISRDHAEIHGVKKADGTIEKYFLCDRSLNGTYINDRRCKRGQPMEISIGDILKFGHLNGASVKDLEVCPQANAEFAFVVEKANNAYHYLGYENGRRAKGIMVHGDTITTINRPAQKHTEMQLDAQGQLRPVSSNPSTSESHHLHNHTNTASVSHGHEDVPQEPQPHLGSASVSHHDSIPTLTNPAAAAAAAAHLSQQSMQQLQNQLYNLYNQNLFGQQALNPWLFQNRPQNVFNPGQIPATTTAGLLQRSFLQQNSISNSMMNSVMMNSLLAPATAAMAMPSPIVSLQQVTQQHTSAMTQPTTQPPIQTTAAIHATPVPLQRQQTSPVPSPPTMPKTENMMPSVNSVKTTSPAVEVPPVRVEQIKESPKSAVEEKQRSPIRSVSPPKKSDSREAREPASPPRRVAPSAPWDSTPSPAPRNTDSPIDHERKSTKSKEHSKPRKNNEVARLFNDLTEGSWVNTVRKSSTTVHRRPTEESLVEERAKKEKKRKEKERVKAEKEREEREAPVVIGQKRSSPKPSQQNTSLTDPKRRMKQLSDEESPSTDSDSDAPPTKKPKQKPQVVQAPKRSMTSGSTSESSDYDSDDSTDKKKKKKKRKYEKKAAPVGRKSSEGRKSVGRPRKSEPKIETAKVPEKIVVNTDDIIRAAQAEVDDLGNPVTTHNPDTLCGLGKECNRPQSENVNWICCDDCDTWYHNICLLGQEESPSDKHFSCGLCERPEKKLKSSKKSSLTSSGKKKKIL